MKDLYAFPAVFHEAEDGISIHFPDLPGCLPCAATMEEAFLHAKEALQLHLYGMEEDKEPIPAPSRIASVPCGKGESLAMIDAWMPPFREKMLNKSTNKTVTIPCWLDLLARNEKIDYSHLLQESLKACLGVQASDARRFRGE